MGPLERGNRTASALEMSLGTRIYLHEYIDIIGASRAAYFLGELNAAQLFREGYGRTQREFIRLFGLKSPIHSGPSSVQ